MGRPALFLDRDGVINVDYGYVFRKEDFHFRHGIFELVLRANRAGYLVVVITNQAGIGRGYYTEEDFTILTNWMKGEFSSRGGIIEDVYFCPFHPQYGLGQYRRESMFRKPNPGMLLQAQLDHGVDLQRSIFIGDRCSDMQAGKRAGIGKLIYLGDSEVMDGVLSIESLDEVVFDVVGDVVEPSKPGTTNG